MAKFIYRMQNVLDLKLKMEDQAKTFFAAAMARAVQEEEKLRVLYSRKDQYEDEYRLLTQRVLKPGELREAGACINNIGEQIVQQAAALRAANKNLEIARYRLNEAVKERKIQEKLKENAFEEFKQELNDAEMKEIDELVSYRFNNNGKAGVK